MKSLWLTQYGQLLEKLGKGGIFWHTNANERIVSLLKGLIKRNPKVLPDIVEDNIWGVTNYLKE